MEYGATVRGPVQSGDLCPEIYEPGERVEPDCLSSGRPCPYGCIHGVKP